MEECFVEHEKDNLEIKCNILSYKVSNQLGDNAFKLLLVKTELDTFGRVTDNTRNMIGV